MTERPILFSGPMVRALLDGRKTQTRRVVKGAVTYLGGRGEEADLSNWGWAFDGPGQHGYAVLERGLDERHDHGRISIPCPYGQPRVRLWVRETWGYRGQAWNNTRPDERRYSVAYAADQSKREFIGPNEPEFKGLPTQRERRRGEDELAYDAYLTEYWRAWRPSIHMPRWASRLALEVTEVRVQRLQECSADDAVAEGISPSDVPGLGSDASLVGAYAALWTSINGAGSWDANPWVWAISFKVLP